MNTSELIEEIIIELSYRVSSGIPDLTNKQHIDVLSDILDEYQLYDVKRQIINNLIKEDEETEKTFKTPVLNKRVTYQAADGKEETNLIGNLLRLPKDSPGRIEAERHLPPEDSEERERINQELGDEGEGAGTDAPQPNAKDPQSQPSDGDDNQDDEEARQRTKAMYQNDPAMKSQLDKEKEIQKQLAKDDEPEKAQKQPKKMAKNELTKMFSQKGESTEGLFTGAEEGYKQLKDAQGKEVPVREIRRDDGSTIDVSNSEGRREASSVIQKRMNELKFKIDTAIINFRASDHAKKWLGETGELALLKECLDRDVEAYLLTDSAIKNDIAFVKRNGDTEDVAISLVSAKTTEGFGAVNGLGANCRGDLAKLSKQSNQTFTDQINGKELELKTDNTMSSMLDTKTQFFLTKSMEEDIEVKQVDGKRTKVIKYNPDRHSITDVNELQVIDGEQYFPSQAEWSRSVRLTEDDVNKFLNDPKKSNKLFTRLSGTKGLGKKESLTDDTEINNTREWIRELILNDIREKKGTYTLSDLNETALLSFGTTLEKSNAQMGASADTVGIHYSEGKDAEISILTADDASQEILDCVAETKKIEDDRERRIHLANNCLGFRMSSRIMGKEGKRTVRPIDNTAIVGADNLMEKRQKFGPWLETQVNS